MSRETSSAHPRQPGTPLPSSFIKALREKSGLTQEQLAQRMGIGGGKAVVSGWETGRTSCEGPAAELLLLLFGGGDPRVEAASLAASLMEEVEGLWRRAGNFEPVWRQTTALLHGGTHIERASFAGLFPEIVVSQKPHGFPPVIGLQNSFGITQAGWVGVIPPAADQVPGYMWVLKRDGHFVYREKMWENDYRSPTRGHVDIRSVMVTAIATAFFFSKLSNVCHFDDALKCTLRIDLGGMQGRGLVRPLVVQGGTLVPVSDREVPTRCAEEHISASTTSSIGTLRSDTIGVGLDLVGELALLLNPDLAQDKALRDTLRAAHKRDQDEGGNYRVFDFLDGQRY